jgi:PIN domain nuclease of toxin-antitoxin system
MKILLDTHILIWWLENNTKLNQKIKEVIQDSTVYVSSVSALEIGIKASIGKLKTPEDLQERLTVNAFIELPFTIAHGQQVAHLPLIHRDPFDRLLIAQAKLEGLTLVTADKIMQQYDVDVALAE